MRQTSTAVTACVLSVTVSSASGPGSPAPPPPPPPPRGAPRLGFAQRADDVRVRAQSRETRGKHLRFGLRDALFSRVFAKRRERGERARLAASPGARGVPDHRLHSLFSRDVFFVPRVSLDGVAQRVRRLRKHARAAQRAEDGRAGRGRPRRRRAARPARRARGGAPAVVDASVRSAASEPIRPAVRRGPRAHGGERGGRRGALHALAAQPPRRGRRARVRGRRLRGLGRGRARRRHAARADPARPTWPRRRRSARARSPSPPPESPAARAATREPLFPIAPAPRSRHRVGRAVDADEPRGAATGLASAVGATHRRTRARADAHAPAPEPDAAEPDARRADPSAPHAALPASALAASIVTRSGARASPRASENLARHSAPR